MGENGETKPVHPSPTIFVICPHLPPFFSIPPHFHPFSLVLGTSRVRCWVYYRPPRPGISEACRPLTPPPLSTLSPLRIRVALYCCVSAPPPPPASTHCRPCPNTTCVHSKNTGLPCAHRGTVHQFCSFRPPASPVPVQLVLCFWGGGAGGVRAMVLQPSCPKRPLGPGGGGVQQKGSIAGPLISCYEIPRQRRRQFF